jgi:predicted metal-dependent hydrolase
MKEIEEMRMKMIEEEQRKNNNTANTICIQQPDGTNKQLTNEEIVNILQQQQTHIRIQQEEIQHLQKREAELNELVGSLQKKIIETILSSPSSTTKNNSKEETSPLFTIEEVEEKYKKLDEILEKTVKEMEMIDIDIDIPTSKIEPLFTLEEEEKEEQIKIELLEEEEEGKEENVFVVSSKIEPLFTL